MGGEVLGAQWRLVSFGPEKPVARTEGSLQGGSWENGLRVGKEDPGTSPTVGKPCSGARGPTRTRGCGPHTGLPPLPAVLPDPHRLGGSACPAGCQGHLPCLPVLGVWDVETGTLLKLVS